LSRQNGTDSASLLMKRVYEIAGSLPHARDPPTLAKTARNA
jgi:hypothetical protein